MSVPALITEGIGPGGSVKYLLTAGLDVGATPPPQTFKQKIARHARKPGAPLGFADQGN